MKSPSPILLRPARSRFQTLFLTTAVLLASIWLAIVGVAEGRDWLWGRLGQIRAFAAPGMIVFGAFILHAFIIRQAGRYLSRFSWIPFVVTWVIALGIWWLWKHYSHLPLPTWYIFGVVSTSVGLATVLLSKAATENPVAANWLIGALPAALIILMSVSSGELGSAGGALLVAVSATSLGARLARGNSASIPVAAFGAAGLAAMLLALRVASYLNLLNPAIVMSLLLVSIAVSFRELKALYGEANKWLRQSSSLSPARSLFVGAIIGLLICYWFGVLAPEIGPDALGGRTALPVRWLKLGKADPVPEIYLSFMGIGGELLNSLLIPFSGFNGAKVLTWVCSALLAALLLTPIEKTEKNTGLSTLLFFGSSVVAWQYGHGFVDVTVCYLALSSFTLFWLAENSLMRHGMAGLALGAALSIKLHVGTLMVAIGFIYVFQIITDSQHRKSKAIYLSLWLSGVLISIVPPTIRSVMETGNPVFPFANSLFKSPLAEGTLQAALYGSGLSLSNFLLPFQILTTPTRFNELGTCHPLFFGLFVLGLLMIQPGNRLGLLLYGISALFWVGWLVSEQNIRYSMPAMAMSAYALANARARDSSLRGALDLLLAPLVLLGITLNFSRPTAWMWGEPSGPAMPKEYLLGLQSRDEYLDIRQPTAALGRLIERDAGSSAVTWLAPFTRDHLYIPGRVISHPHGDVRVLRKLLGILPGPDAPTSDQEILKPIIGEKIRYFITAPDCWWIRDKPESDWQSIFSAEFLSRNAKMLGANRGYRLYRFRFPSEEHSETPDENEIQAVNNQYKVIPGQLLKVRFTFGSRTVPGAYVDMVWLGSGGELVFFDRVPIPEGGVGQWHTHSQTIPAHAATLSIHRSTGLDDLKIDVTER